MAIEKGSSGSVVVESTVVGEVRGYEFTEEADTEETNVTGSDSVRFSPTLYRSSGTVDVLQDNSDSGQNTLAAGASVKLLFQPQGAGAGLPQAEIDNAIITGIRETLAAESYNQRTFTFVAGKVNRANQT